ncbi:Diacylglycerol kinase [Anaerohalosphaera lusitana]|uniref:Diacylglycerol kinase n=1 Tax=Anaerohalosphaera lusitana TaxID=1936003 RepID=A0A1U9NK49_9BACT|nr:diacylglycerol kinase family protein [Anaerohalosphaera lusitana]AQT68301.1 Diacylglycerol kinase [Anaerohalosphaera lusitana]
MNISKEGYILFIINPSSGKSSSKLMFHEFRSYLEEKGYSIKIAFTESLEHAQELARKAAVEYDCKLVVAAGGDGTVREIVQGLEGSDKPMMIVPAGTENLLANEMGYDEKGKTLIKAFEGDASRDLDLGKANGRCFTCVAGFGFDANVIDMVNERREGHINHLDYFWPIWRTFWAYKFPDITVSVDGEQIHSGPGILFVGNISRYAVGLEILQNADFGDGLLDVCIYKCESQIQLLKHSVFTLSKRHINASDVVYRQGKIVEIGGDPQVVSCQLDGDPGPDLPVKIRLIPQAVKVLVPPDAKPAGIRTRLVRALG